MFQYNMLKSGVKHEEGREGTHNYSIGECTQTVCAVSCLIIITELYRTVKFMPQFQHFPHLTLHYNDIVEEEILSS